MCLQAELRFGEARLDQNMAGSLGSVRRHSGSLGRPRVARAAPTTTGNEDDALLERIEAAFLRVGGMVLKTVSVGVC